MTLMGGMPLLKGAFLCFLLLLGFPRRCSQNAVNIYSVCTPQHGPRMSFSLAMIIYLSNYWYFILERPWLACNIKYFVAESIHFRFHLQHPSGEQRQFLGQDGALLLIRNYRKEACRLISFLARLHSKKFLLVFYCNGLTKKMTLIQTRIDALRAELT